MSTGFAHIIELGMAPDLGDLRVPQYQFTYDDGANTYARTFAENDLIDFMRNDLGLHANIVDGVLADLRSDGNALVRDVHIANNDAAAMGMVQAASDV